MLNFSKKILVWIILIIILSINTYIFAEFEYKINLSGTTEITKGKIVNVTLSIDDVRMPPTDEIEVSCILDYDRNVFDKLETQNIEEKNNWNITYSGEKNEFLATFSEGELKSGAICIFSFKVRDDAEFDKTKIVVKDLKLAMQGEENEKKLQNVEIEFENKQNSSIIKGPKENKNSIKTINQTKKTTTSNKRSNTIQQEKDNSDEIQLYIAIALLTIVIIAVIVVFTIMHRK